MDPAPIAKLRSELAAQVKRPLEVSEKFTQYYFNEDSAAYNDIDVKLGDAFAVVVCQGALPSEELICRVWHKYADEVWLVDRAENNIFIVPREGVIRVFEVGETLHSKRLPDVAINVAGVFSIAN